MEDGTWGARHILGTEERMEIWHAPCQIPKWLLLDEAFPQVVGSHEQWDETRLGQVLFTMSVCEVA